MTCTDAVGREAMVMIAVTEDHRLVVVPPAGGSVNFTLDQIKEAEEYRETISSGLEVLKLLRRRRDKQARRRQRGRQHGKRGPQS